MCEFQSILLRCEGKEVSSVILASGLKAAVSFVFQQIKLRLETQKPQCSDFHRLIILASW